MKSKEFENFDRTMRELIKVPHEEIKSQLEAEKSAKGKRIKKASNKKNNNSPHS